MEKKDIMSRKEWTRLEVVKKVIEKQMTQRKAASILGLSERQIKRIVKRVRREGMKKEVNSLHNFNKFN